MDTKQLFSVDTSALGKNILVATNALLLKQPEDHPIRVARQASRFGAIKLDASYSANAQAVIAGFLFYFRLSIDFYDGSSSSNPILRFESDVWGIGGVSTAGFGGGVSFNVAPGDLSGTDADVQVGFAPGVMSLAWWNSGTPLGAGVLNGAGLNLAGACGGRGHFS
jgi:hypothetical protein